MQQYLPFTVLKLAITADVRIPPTAVATVLTVYGIETIMYIMGFNFDADLVATVLTVYGIETNSVMTLSHSIKLQQYLPFTVLKPPQNFYRYLYSSCNSTYRLRY